MAGIPGASIGVASRCDTQFRLECNRACGVAEDGLQESEVQKKPAEEAEVGSITPQLVQVLHGRRCRKREQ